MGRDDVGLGLTFSVGVEVVRGPAAGADVELDRLVIPRADLDLVAWRIEPGSRLVGAAGINLSARLETRERVNQRINARLVSRSVDGRREPPFLVLGFLERDLLPVVTGERDA